MSQPGMRQLHALFAPFDKIMQFLSASVFVSATIFAIIISAISAGIALFYAEINITETDTSNAFTFIIALVASIVISVEAQTKLQTVLANIAQINAADHAIRLFGTKPPTPFTDFSSLPNTRINELDRYNTILAANFATLSGPCMQRNAAISNIRLLITSYSIAWLRIACMFLIFINIVFLQSRFTTTTDYFKIASNHFCTTWPSLVVIMLIHDISREAHTLATPYLL